MVMVLNALSVPAPESPEFAPARFLTQENFFDSERTRQVITPETERGGHISPIAAYNEESDRLLILDVSRYKYPPVWVKTEELWQAMATVDSVSGKTRGFVLVSRE